MKYIIGMTRYRTVSKESLSFSEITTHKFIVKYIGNKDIGKTHYNLFLKQDELIISDENEFNNYIIYRYHAVSTNTKNSENFENIPIYDFVTRIGTFSSIYYNKFNDDIEIVISGKLQLFDLESDADAELALETLE